MKSLRYLACMAPVLLLFSCSGNSGKNSMKSIDPIAQEYVKLGLFIGQYDGDFVDAYYGPDSLKPKWKPDSFPKDSILQKADQLNLSLDSLINDGNPDSLRAKWMKGQLKAFSRRVKIFSGEFGSFDEESRDLFGVVAPEYPAAHYQQLLDSLNKVLPGQGPVEARFQTLANRFIIPKDKLDTVFKTTIAKARQVTKAHYTLPDQEKFTLSYVTDKPWSGYNWYKGNYTSEIQINTDTDIFIERAIDVGSHESYPGHHVYNMLLEKNLYRDKGWIEISLYPLFSPQSFIAEGSANYGIELIFPGDEKIKFAKNTLLPLAGLPAEGIDLYFKALEIRGKLNYARNEAARGIVNGTMSEAEALAWLQKYCLYNAETAAKSISFIKKYRSYVINYNYGQDLVRSFINRYTSGQHWSAFAELLSNPVSPESLSK